MKKFICICLSIVLCFSMVLSGCTKAVGKITNEVLGETAKGSSQASDSSTGNDGENEDIKQSIKDSMNQVLDNSDIGLTEKEKQGVNDLFDIFAKFSE